MCNGNPGYFSARLKTLSPASAGIRKIRSLYKRTYFPFDPEKSYPMLGDIAGETTKIQAVLRCSMRNLDKPVLKVYAALIEKTSKISTSLPVSILDGNKEGEMGTLLAEFKMPQMAP